MFLHTFWFKFVESRAKTYVKNDETHGTFRFFLEPQNIILSHPKASLSIPDAQTTSLKRSGLILSALKQIQNMFIWFFFEIFELPTHHPESSCSFPEYPWCTNNVSRTLWIDPKYPKKIQKNAHMNVFLFFRAPKHHPKLS